MTPENENSSLSTVTLNHSPASRAWQKPLLFVALLALVLAGWQWLETRQQLRAMQELVTEVGASDKEARGAQKQLLEQVEALQAKLGAVDGKLAEFQGRSDTLQTLYQDITRSREDAALLEIEQAITLAGQQLQLAGNVPVAVLALQAADARLARLDRPQYLPLRKALARDLARLNALPFVDAPGISLRLEQLVVSLDKLPLVAYGRPVDKAVSTRSGEPSMPWWQRFGSDVWQELKGLVRIQRFDREEPVLLAPGQEYFLRENLKLRLLNARLALLSHDRSIFRSELKMVDEALGRHFVRDDKAVQAAQALLHPLLTIDVSLELPSLNDSQSALRALRNGKEKR